MKKLLLILLLLFSPLADGQVSIQSSRNNVGTPIIRIYNNFQRPVSCYFRDQYNYYTFVVYPHSFSMWYPVYGQYQWQCR